MNEDKKKSRIEKWQNVPRSKLENSLMKAFMYFVGIAMFTELFVIPIYLGNYKGKGNKVERQEVIESNYEKLRPIDHLYFGHIDYNQLEKELLDNK